MGSIEAQPAVEVNLFDWYRPHRLQREAHEATESFVLFGGAVGGGKSVWLVMDALLRSLYYSHNRVGLYRYQYSDFMRTTYKTLQEWLLVGERFPYGRALVAKHDQQKHEITLTNGSQIVYGGLLPTRSVSGDILSVAKSLEVSSIHLDELTDFPENMYNFLFSRLARHRAFDVKAGEWTTPESPVPPRVAATCNPEPGWIKARFVDRKLPNHRFIRSRIADNPYVGRIYREGTIQGLGGNQELIDRYVNGDWNVVFDYTLVYHPDWLQAAVDRQAGPTSPVVFGVDVAAYGDDKSVVVMRRGMKAEILYDSAARQSTMELANIVANLADRWGPEKIVIDSIGVGQGVHDRLNEMFYPVVSFVGGAKPKDPQFLNRRTEAYWGLRLLLERGDPDLPNHSEAINELGSIKYMRSASDKTIQVEKKDNIKKRLGHSPDYADAFVYAFDDAAWDYPDVIQV